MSKSVLEITEEHGRQMHILGLKHAIEILKIVDREEALKHLTEKVAAAEKELKDEPRQV